MSEKLELKAEKREKLGKNFAVKLREKNRIPAVIYGPDLKENIYITIAYNEFEKIYRHAHKNNIISLILDGKEYKVICKDYKIDSVSRKLLHVDFLLVNEKVPFSTEVPVEYKGTPAGVKEGGNLFIFKKTLKILGLLKNIPEKIEVDISSLKIGQHLIVRDIKNDKYKILTHEGTTLVEVK